MHYLVLSLPETLCTYLGLAIQMLLRQVFLRHAPLVIVGVNIMLLLWREQDRPHALRPALTYAVVSLGLLVLFWPDVTRVGIGAGRVVSPTQIGSYAGSQDGAGALVTAGDVRDLSLGVGDQLANPVRAFDSVLEPLGMRLMLMGITDFWLGLARALNSQTHRPMASIVPMEWLAGMSLTADLTRALQDWLEGCYKPSLLQDKEFQDAITSEQLLPWGNTPVAQALATREVRPGAQTGAGYFRTRTPLGVSFLQNPGSNPQLVRCDIYLAAVELDVQRWLTQTTSPAGTPVSAVFADEFGLDMQTQGRMIIHREMLRLLKMPVPAPSLAGSYALLSGANAVLGAAGGALSPKPGLGALFGGGQAVLSQAEQGVQRLLWWVGIAAWLLYWLPYLLGITQMVLIGFAPIIYLWMLWPGQQLQALLIYFVTLAWVYSSPCWFALVDVLARLAGALAPKSQDPLLQVLSWAPEQVAQVVVTVMALAAVPLLLGLLMFRSLQRIHGMMRATSTP